MVYLLGSIHLLKSTDYPLPPVIESAFTNSQVAAFETDIGELEGPLIQLKLLSKASLPEGETLKQHLSASVYASFSNHVAELGMPMLIFDRLKPSLAAATVELFELEKLGVDPEYGVDQYFFNRARKRGDRIIPLETVDFQVNLATDFSKEEGELLMKSSLEEIDETKKLYGEMVAAWKTGDAASLEKLLNSAMRDAPAVYKRLVTDRNKRWTPKIEALLRGNQNAIVIVGAGHLVGSEGVVELLRKKGWRIIQM